ncbi:ferredoxin [Blastococcus sp. URHD0036]|uniref:ferredoxin n=1 Tax=Blastococcus sp. URHD0036 TaxID=1380356 RepID=UPI00049660B0|nr:ferredoxin [Blastococcus sp. URHD0036]
MKVTVDSTVCQGHTLCAMTAPDLFVLSDEDGHAAAAVDAVPPGREEAAREAARTCPEQAVALS